MSDNLNNMMKFPLYENVSISTTGGDITYLFLPKAYSQPSNNNLDQRDSIDILFKSILGTITAGAVLTASYYSRISGYLGNETATLAEITVGDYLVTSLSSDDIIYADYFTLSVVLKEAVGSAYTISGEVIVKKKIDETSSYSNSTPVPNTLGGIDAGTIFTGATMKEMWDNLLYGTSLYPDFVNPSNLFVASQSGLQEVGKDIGTVTFTASFNRGSISPSYGTSGFRSGLPNEYNYTGSDLIDNPSTSLTDIQSITHYTVLLGLTTWTNSVSYDIGEQPKDSEGNNYSSPLPAGDTTFKSVSITGVYPFFANTVDIDTLTKQPLALMDSVYVEFTCVAETDISKEKFEFPDAWTTITGIQAYNPITGWDWIQGTKANSLLCFNTTEITIDINGTDINYTRYEHNKAKVGPRMLRVYTT